jgi:chromosome segregation ATPase
MKKFFFLDKDVTSMAGAGGDGGDTLQGMKQQIAAFAAQINSLEEQNQGKTRFEQAQRELAEEQAVSRQLRARIEEMERAAETATREGLERVERDKANLVEIDALVKIVEEVQVGVAGSMDKMQLLERTIVNLREATNKQYDGIKDVNARLKAMKEKVSPGSGACACLFACSFACLFMGGFAADVLCILECGFVARGFVVIK